MNPPLDLELVVSDWLRNEASASGSDSVLAATLGRVSTVRQERRRPAWLPIPMSRRLKVAMVAASAVVFGVASVGLLTRGSDIGPGLIVGSTPTPSSTPPTYPPAGEIPPGQSQSLTVDGVPLSFSVPNGGWAPGIQRKAFGVSLRADTLYIAKGTAGGQRAEAVVFWTTYPGGVNTGPCHNLLSQPIAADLASAMATAPGTDLVTGPSNVTLGEHEAKHLVLTIREDLGCDPGYFFTWPDECWGTCWIKTGVGDRIGVWVVEVDGKRLVIETETTRQGVWVSPSHFVEETTELSDAELEQEVQQIVELIRFES